MPRKRTGYDAACYYDGKLLGRCTKADSDAYTLLMNACGGEARHLFQLCLIGLQNSGIELFPELLCDRVGHIPVAAFAVWLAAAPGFLRKAPRRIF